MPFSLALFSLARWICMFQHWNEFVNHTFLQFEGKFMAFCVSCVLLHKVSTLKYRTFIISVSSSGTWSLVASDSGPLTRLQPSHLKASWESMPFQARSHVSLGRPRVLSGCRPRTWHMGLSKGQFTLWQLASPQQGGKTASSRSQLFYY